MSRADDTQEKCWLVKSSTRILGPYSAEELGQLLLKKHISIIDEVQPPVGRWRYIREHKIFDEVVQTLRAEQENSHEHTQTSTATATATMTSTTSAGTQPLLTRTDAIYQPDSEFTQTPTPPPISDAILAVKDIVPVRETNLTVTSDVLRGGKVFGAATDQRVQREVQEIQKRTRLIVIGTSLVIALGIGLMQMRKSWRRDRGYESLIQEALRDRSLGLYEKALVAYRKAAEIREPSTDIQVQMAPLLIVLDRQNVWGRRVLERDIQEDKSDRTRVVDSTLAIAMSYILEGSLKEAEDALERVLVLEPTNFAAHLNQALIQLRKGDWVQADRKLEDLSRRQSPHPLVLLARGVSMLESGNKDALKAHDLSGEIQAHLGRGTQLRPELLLVSAALLSPADPKFNELIDAFLAEPLRQAGLYRKDLRLDWRISEWDSLEKLCRDMTSRSLGSARVKATRAVCLAEAGRDADSKIALNEALAEDPKDPLILFTQANLLDRAGLRNEATAVLRLPQVAAYPMSAQLNGHICLQAGDLGCAERAFRIVLASGQKSLAATAGLAQVLLQQDRKNDARTLVSQGLEQDPAYLPLIELQMKIDEAP